MTRSIADTSRASARFGELRSIAHGQPSQAAWTRLTTLVRTLCDEGGEALTLWDEQLAPYLDATLEHWPAHLRMADVGDTIALLHGGKLSPLLAISRALRSVERPRTRISLEHWSRLAHHAALARIAHLQLRGPAFDAACWAVLLESPHSRNLRSLDLVDCAFGARGARRLFGGSIPGQLTALRMRGCEIGREGGWALRGADLSRVETLELMGCRIGMAGIRALAQSPDGPSPLHLRLDGLDMLCTEAWPALIDSPRLLTRVESLEIRSAPLYSGPRVPLPELLDRCPPLRRFEVNLLQHSAARLSRDLAHPTLANLGALRARLHSGPHGRHTAALLDAPFIPVLRELNLSDSLIGDDDARIIAACDRLAGLESLRLDRCTRITAAGLDALLASPHLCATARAQLATQRIVEPRR